jgi:hypothetical protein
MKRFITVVVLLIGAASLFAQQSASPSAPSAGQAPAPNAGRGTPPAATPYTPPTVAAQGMKYVGTMSELMINLIYPTSDAILYVSSRTPTNDVEWNDLRAKALVLAESANLLMMPGRARDQGKWMEYSKAMLDAAQKAFIAAKAHDADAIAELNDPVYQSCTQCHLQYRPSYGRGR